MSKKETKITDNELKEIQGMLNSFNQFKIQLADAELTKQGVFAKIEDLKKEYSRVEAALTEKYGIDNRIDLQSGIVSEKEKVKE